MIYTKVGDQVVNIRIDRACYFDDRLIQVHGTVDGSERLLYISDLKGDAKGEVEVAVNAARKTAEGKA